MHLISGHEEPNRAHLACSVPISKAVPREKTRMAGRNAAAPVQKIAKIRGETLWQTAPCVSSTNAGKVSRPYASRHKPLGIAHRTVDIKAARQSRHTNARSRIGETAERLKARVAQLSRRWCSARHVPCSRRASPSVESAQGRTDATDAGARRPRRTVALHLVSYDRSLIEMGRPKGEPSRHERGRPGGR
jgi:hypothetical protein